MIGRRIPVVVGESGYSSIPDSFFDDLRPGDYCGPIFGYTGQAESVVFLKPNGRDPNAPSIAHSLQHVISPPHRFRECPDGSLEIRESIAATRAGSDVDDGWHGYLDEGHRWRQV